MTGVPQTGIGIAADVPGATPLPMRSAGAFGAAIGEGIGELGNVLQREQARAKEMAAKRQYEVDASAAGVETAQAQLDISQTVEDIRSRAAPGAAGHVEATAKAVDERFGAVLSGIQNPVLRGQYAANLAQTRARILAEENGWAAGEKVAYQVTNIKRTGDAAANAVLNKPDAATFGEGLQTLATTIGNQGLAAGKAEQLLREQSAELATARAKGLTLADPKQALAWLGGDEASAYLDADKRVALIREAETQLRIADADARRVQAQDEAQLREDVAEFKQAIARGELPSDDTEQGLIKRAQALGLNNLVDDIRYEQGKLKLSRETDKWTPAEWARQVDPLAAKVANGKASGEEQMTLKVLQELRPGKEARFRNNPEQAAAASGLNPPQVDLANPEPGTIAARKSWARAFARSGGLIEPPYLGKDQLQIYRERAAQGPVGQLEVAADLKRTWGMDAAPSIVRSIGGEAKGDMLIMLGLNERMAQVYRRGGDALSKKAVKFDDDKAREAWAKFAPAVPPDVGPALFEAARKIAAGLMVEQGKTEPTADFSKVFEASVQRAAGRAGVVTDWNAPGGLAEHNGRYAWLPQDMSSNDFKRRIARAEPMAWVRAAVDERGNPVQRVPHYIGPDGKRVPYTKRQAARFGTMRLETVAPGIYRLLGSDGGPVVDADGRPWQFDVRRLK